MQSESSIDITDHSQCHSVNNSSMPFVSASNINTKQIFLQIFTKCTEHIMPVVDILLTSLSLVTKLLTCKYMKYKQRFE